MTGRRVEISESGVRGMAWIHGELIDVAGGWAGLFPARRQRTHTNYGDDFDTVVVSPQTDVVALVASRGTKSLLLALDGSVIREIDRSYYHAGVFRYPLALFTLPDGQTGLAHCPSRYNQLEIEVATTGHRPAPAIEREPADVFDSRLAVSTDGGSLLSAGWLWQPWDVLAVFDMHRALSDPSALDGQHALYRAPFQVEVGGACFLGDDVMLGTALEVFDPDEPVPLKPSSLARWSPISQSYLWTRLLERPAGDLVAIGDNLLALNEYPRLYEGSSGDLLDEWPDLPTGRSISSITGPDAFCGPGRIAVDPTAPRFAYTDSDRVVVVDAST